MKWNNHSELEENNHAFLSASKYSWLNYDREKLINTYANHLATLRGTQLHEFASLCIKMKQRLPDEPITLNMFVNDAIENNLRSEQKLKYSDLCYGTADAIGLDEDLMILKVRDLKTGTHKASMPQLEIYSALFCLEYEFSVRDINGFQLIIFQNNNKYIHSPSRERISEVMDKIVESDKILQEADLEGGFERWMTK